MNEAQLRELIQNGENSWLEFKLDQLRPEGLAREMVAFLNHEGGTILLGIRDDKTIAGIERKDLEAWVMNAARTLIQPPAIPSYEEVKIEGKKVGIVRIREGIDKPYFLIHKGRESCYIRVGTTTRRCSREEIRRLYQASALIHYDTLPVSATGPADLDLQKLKEYFLKTYGLNVESLNTSDRLSLLKNAQFLAEEDGRFSATVAGLLLFGKDPSRHLSNSGVTFAFFEGREIGSTLLDRKELSGTLAENVEAVRNLINLHTCRPSEIEGLTRQEKIAYPDIVVREGMVNAVVHRDYTIGGAKVRVFLFSDRLEIKSPGKLPNTVTLEKMRAGVSISRNPLLTKVMQNLGYIDALGRGVPMILREMKAASEKEPKIEIEGEEVILTLYA